jgi:serine phosphatase RsbU (regulator of sigma subunit)
LIAKLKEKWAHVERFYRLYTTGLNRKEVELLLKKDAREAFEYYKEKSSLGEGALSRRSLWARIRGVSEIFLSFLMQLSPGRRFFYGMSIVGFAIGFLWTKWLWVFCAFAIVNLLLALELANKLTTRDELEIAREIQVSLQPQILPEIPGLGLSAYSRPARIVGGDFFNVCRRADSRMMSIVGDVSGKGIPAALYAAHVQSLFESLSEKNASPAEILKEMNRIICRRLREGDFITAVIAFFEPGRKDMTIARAGHNWPLYYQAREQAVHSLSPAGVCLGIDADGGFAECLREETLAVSSGDLLLLYSDGITEATDAANRLFDLRRLKEALKEHSHLPADQIVAGINHRLNAFIGSEELRDDVTMVVMKVH